jgi:hypothetical protein
MDTTPIVARLWDYGWLCRDTVQLAPAASDSQLLQRYVSSPSFHTSFLPSDKDETGIHGPFEAGRLSADDYTPLGEADLESYLESVELSEVPGDDVAERAKLLPYLRCAFAAGRRCYVLRRDERDRELFHEWGIVLFVFREFLFADERRESLERFVIGYD